MSRILFCFLCVGLSGAVMAPDVEARGSEPKIRVLIVDGFSNHDWRLTTRSIRSILQPSGLFVVDVSTSPPDAGAPGWDKWRPRFDDYDVVIQQCNDINGGPSWPGPVRESLERYVRRGGGLYVWHSGNNAFANWPEYNAMIGMGWRDKSYGTAIAVGDDGKLLRFAPGEGENTGHGARFDALITRVGDHPIQHGMPRQWTAADIEVYYYVRGPAKHLQILSYAHEPKTQMNWPTEWTVRYGRGRVYTSTFGHVWKGDVDPVTVRDVGVQTSLIRGVQWLAHRAANYPVPATFPGAGAKSVGPPLAR
ncbi:MAG: ThuA domain-containing protein [Pseudomonadota bacterium]